MPRPARTREAVLSAFNRLTAEPGHFCTAYGLGKEAGVSRIVARHWLKVFAREEIAIQLSDHPRALFARYYDPLA